MCVVGVVADHALRARSVLNPNVFSLAEFQLENPDCNPTQMRKDIKSFLEEIAYSDGDYSEVEELAIEAVENILNHSLAGHRQITKAATDYAKMSAGVVGDAASSASKIVDSATKNASSMVKAIWKKKS